MLGSWSKRFSLSISISMHSYFASAEAFPRFRIQANLVSAVFVPGIDDRHASHISARTRTTSCLWWRVGDCSSWASWPRSGGTTTTTTRRIQWCALVHLLHKFSAISCEAACGGSALETP
ncbi:hypothetical protein LZ32DRAFT_323443 [Colletotrichum eremochloae]|nr:hypothetical protein LZ32DRAFT_323443 [Colletotrichum eremochloae]